MLFVVRRVGLRVGDYEPTIFGNLSGKNYLQSMPEGGYKIRDQQAIHYITFSVVEWVDAFSRAEYKHILLNHIRHSQEQNGLMLHAWVLMTNHFHGVMSAKEGNELSAILRDIKKYSSVNILKAIENNDKESRQEWMLEIFGRNGKENARNTKYQFWQQHNHPIELDTNKKLDQRLNYIHQNPVQAGIVLSPEDYLYSSVMNYAEKPEILLDVMLLY